MKGTTHSEGSRAPESILFYTLANVVAFIVYMHTRHREVPHSV